MATSDSNSNPHYACNGEAKRRSIVCAAKELYATKGIRHTGVRDIMDRVGLTRSLFYHYFKDKDELNRVIVSGYVDSFLENITEWRRDYDAQNAVACVADEVARFRAQITDPDPIRVEFRKPENADLHQLFARMSADRIAYELASHGAEEGSAVEGAPIDPVRYQAFHIAALGLISVLYYDPEVSDRVLAEAVCQLMAPPANRQD